MGIAWEKLRGFETIFSGAVEGYDPSAFNAGEFHLELRGDGWEAKPGEFDGSKTINLTLEDKS